MAKRSVESGKRAGKVRGVAVAAARMDGCVMDTRVCSMTDAILWAYEHCGVGGLTDGDAPSRLAWCLLNDFEGDVDYKRDLFKQVAVAKARKEEAQENYGGDRFDGKAEYDILARLGGKVDEDLVGMVGDLDGNASGNVSGDVAGGVGS